MGLWSYWDKNDDDDDDDQGTLGHDAEGHRNEIFVKR